MEASPSPTRSRGSRGNRRITCVTVRGLLASALVLTGALVPSSPVPAMAAGATPRITLLEAPTAVRRGEAAFLRGEVTAGSKAVRREQVEVQVRRGGRWRRLESARTGRAGRFVVQVSPKGRTRYRIRLAARPRSSVVVKVRRTKERRTLADRRAGLGFVLGKARGKTRTTRSRGSRVLHQRFRRGMVAQLGRNAFVVHGRMWKQYRKAGGLKGRLGAPRADMKCQLIEGGCIQRFQGGSIYLNRHARRKVSIGYARDRTSQLLAVALSQAGYVEPGYRNSKYGAWQRSRDAWCGIYLAWASRAAGMGNAVPRAHTFGGTTAAARKSGRTGRKPRVGSLAFYGSGTPWHVGLVVSVRGNRIHTVEGNVARHSDTGFPRGVFRKTRSVSAAKFFYYPG